VAFCNEACREAAKFFHQFECGFLNAFYGFKEAHLAFRTLLATSPEKLIGLANILFYSLAIRKDSSSSEYMKLEKMPTDAQATKFGVGPLSPDFVFGTNYDSVFHMVSNSDHFAPANESCVPVYKTLVSVL